MSDFFFGPTDNERAIKLIKDKLPVRQEVFRELLPELRSRAITVAGIEEFDVLQTIRDRIAELPAGGDWNKIKKELVKDISPHLVDSTADPEELARQVKAAERRAELLLRTHGFQAYQQAAWETMDAQRDVFPFWQYQTMGDHKVRATHAALDGVVLPESSSFWQGHFPPWEFGCRCQVVPLMDLDVEDMREAEAELPPERRKVVEGQALRDMEAGRLVRGPNEIYDLRTPQEKEGRKAYHFNPADAHLTVDQIKERYDPETWAQFETWAKQAQVSGDQTTVWDWMDGAKPKPPEATDRVQSAEELEPQLQAILGDRKLNPLQRTQAFHRALELPRDEQGQYFHSARTNKAQIDTGFGFVSRITHQSLAPKERVRIRQTRIRAAADHQGRGINGKAMSARTVAHELGHIIESRNPEVLKKSLAFRTKRAAGESPAPIGRGYKESEIGVRDFFAMRGGDLYTGKVYPGDVGSEILSTGIERLMYNPAEFFRDDPEYFNFVINTLRGK